MRAQLAPCQNLGSGLFGLLFVDFCQRCPKAELSIDFMDRRVDLLE